MNRGKPKKSLLSSLPQELIETWDTRNVGKRSIKWQYHLLAIWPLMSWWKKSANRAGQLHGVWAEPQRVWKTSTWVGLGWLGGGFRSCTAEKKAAMSRNWAGFCFPLCGGGRRRRCHPADRPHWQQVVPYLDALLLSCSTLLFLSYFIFSFLFIF